jgi:SAM-dependent methyltransferase
MMNDDNEEIETINAHQFGNFHKYYSFHPTSSRTSLMKEGFFYQIWQSQNQPSFFSLLDVGCNEGNLSLELLRQAQKELPNSVKCIMLGIDIDSNLIDLANIKFKDICNTGVLEFKTVDFMDINSKFYLNYFLSSNNLSGFSFISLFSITMWIHLNWGDVSLKTFIGNAIELLTIPGSILIEPQPWKCYRNAAKRCRKMGLKKPKCLDEIKIQNIDEYIVDIVENEFKMQYKWILGKESWGRSIIVFHTTKNEFLIWNENEDVKIL